MPATIPAIVGTVKPFSGDECRGAVAVDGDVVFRVVFGDSGRWDIVVDKAGDADVGVRVVNFACESLCLHPTGQLTEGGCLVDEVLVFMALTVGCLVFRMDTTAIDRMIHYGKYSIDSMKLKR